MSIITHTHKSPPRLFTDLLARCFLIGLNRSSIEFWITWILLSITGAIHPGMILKLDINYSQSLNYLGTPHFPLHYALVGWIVGEFSKVVPLIFKFYMLPKVTKLQERKKCNWYRRYRTKSQQVLLILKGQCSGFS